MWIVNIRSWKIQLFILSAKDWSTSLQEAFVLVNWRCRKTDFDEIPAFVHILLHTTKWGPEFFWCLYDVLKTRNWIGALAFQKLAENSAMWTAKKRSYSMQKSAVDSRLNWFLDVFVDHVFYEFLAGQIEINFTFSPCNEKDQKRPLTFRS